MGSDDRQFFRQFSMGVNGLLLGLAGIGVLYFALFAPQLDARYIAIGVALLAVGFTAVGLFIRDIIKSG